ncbi:MAG: hypothetical protein QM802_23890 [Agriterribacter sp.]
MLSREKIEIYKRCNGDGDAWAMSSRGKEKSLIDDSDWSLIDNFIQDIKLIKNGLAADSYAKDVQQRLKTHCDNEQIIEELYKLTEKY